MVKVAVIIPVYNVEKYLPQCLDSVINQTLSDIEIICVNDGSTDKSGKILAEFAAKDKRIKVINQQNQGQSVARNKGLQLASGKYIFFVDSDDFIHRQTLEYLFFVAEKTGCKVVASPVGKNSKKLPYGAKNSKYHVYENALLHLLQNSASSSVIWNKLYSADLVKDKKFIEGICFEDWPWVTCLFALLDKYAVVTNNFYYYNTSNQSTMRSIFTSKKIADYAVGIRAVKKFFAQPNYVSQWQVVRQKRIISSLKMMINKTYHEKVNRAEIDKELCLTLGALHCEKCFYYKELPFKVLFRLLKIKIRMLGE